jgi:hypothetical protein
MRKSLALAAIACGILLSSGCASLNSSVPFQYQPSLVSSGQQIEKSAAFTLLTDDRPENDRKYTKSIKDVSDKITSKLIEDFQASRLFKDVHYLPQDNDDIIISGTIRRFKWKLYATPISYIPYVNLVLVFGIPSTTAYGVVDIELVLQNKTTGEELGRFSAASEVKTHYTMYNFKSGEAGAELAECLRDVAKDLKRDIALNLK